MAKKVLVAGLNVVVQQSSQTWYGPTPHWKILELFYKSLQSCQFGAIQVDRRMGRSVCDYALDRSLDIVPLNEGPYARIGRLRETPRIYSRLLRTVAESDYVYIRFPSWVGLTAWRCARWLGKPYWISVHGDWERILSTYVNGAETLSERIFYQLSRMHAANALKNAIAHARSAFFVGYTLRDRLLQDGTPSIVYHDATHTAAEVWSPRRTCTQQKLTLLFVGELSKAKGVDVLMRAAEILARKGYQLRLVFVGLGPEKDTLQRQKIAGVEIELKGWVAQGQAFDQLFLNADALVLPSLTEGVPRVVVEAMVRATPVIATTVGDIPEMLGNGRRGWLVSPSNSDSLVKAVEELAGDARLRIAKTEDAIEYARMHDKTYWTQKIRGALEQMDAGLARSGIC